MRSTVETSDTMVASPERMQHPAVAHAAPGDLRIHHPVPLLHDMARPRGRGAVDISLDLDPMVVPAIGRVAAETHHA